MWLESLKKKVLPTSKTPEFFYMSVKDTDH